MTGVQTCALPISWNAQDALGGKHDYKRGIGNYTKKIFIRPEWQGKRLFLRFEGANCVSNVFVNGKHIGEHRGGYGAFVFEITDKVEYGKENTLLLNTRHLRHFYIHQDQVHLVFLKESQSFHAL